MKFQQWPKRDPDKNYFKVPNEVFHIGLSYPEISIYCYLPSIEDRETYQCYPSYKTIGKALGMSENTMSKYVRSLEEKGLIRTEPTTVRSKEGRPLNGNLLYTICPIQAAIELFYERQFRQMEEDAARQRAVERLAELARAAPRTPCVLLSERERVPVPIRGWRPNLARFRRRFRGQQGSRRSPAKRVRWEKEEQRNEQVFALWGGNEGCGACDDEKQDKRRGRRSTSARTAGSCGGFCGAWKWGQSPGSDIISAVTIPKSVSEPSAGTLLSSLALSSASSIPL